MSTEQSIRLTARGEFGQLQRGLKNLQGDLKNVTGEIDKGARKGGIFDDSQVRALDLFRRRYTEALDGINKEFSKQNNLIDDLHKKMQQATGDEQKAIKEQIKLREKELDVIRLQLFEVEKLYDKRNIEAGAFGRKQEEAERKSRQSATSQGLSSGGGGAGSGILGGVLGAGRFALGLAGVGGIASLVTEAYQQAYAREVNSLDLAQRLRGNGFQGSATSMYDQVSEVGRRDRMGYQQEESWQLQDAYTQTAGELGARNQYAIQKFSRGYGLDATQVGTGIAGIRAMGGISSPEDFLDSLAGSVESSGMTPRVLEVMEAQTGLLAQLNTTFKEGTSRQILAYQTTLDKIGNEKDMLGLTGAQGARVISGLGGIYQPGDDKWKWLGVQALQQYKPDKYGSMGLYDIEMGFEDGLANKDNLPAMVELLRDKSGGDENIFKRMMQSWLTDGGMVATKRQASELYEATNGMEDLANIDSILDSLSKGDFGAKYSERADEKGQEILDVEARYTKALEGIGSKFVDAITDLKGGVTTVLEWINGHEGNIDQNIQNVWNWFKEHGSELATVASVGGVAFGIGLLLKSAIDFGSILTGFKGLFTENRDCCCDDEDGIDDTIDTSRKNDDDTDVPNKASGKLKSVGKGGKIAGAVGGALLAVSMIDGAHQRMLEGDTEWNSWWKSAVSSGTFGLIDPSHVYNQEQGTSNKQELFKAQYGIIKDTFDIATDPANENNFGRSKEEADGKIAEARKQQAKALWDSGMDTLTIDRSTSEGLEQTVQVMKSLGLTSDEIPQSMADALRKSGIGYDSVKEQTLEDLAKSVTTINATADALDKMAGAGAESFKGIKKDTSSTMEFIKNTHASDMDAIKNEHMGIKEFLMRAWSPILALHGLRSGGGSLVEQTAELIGANEGNYDSVNPNDNGALSIGKMQWRGNRARDLLSTIKEKDAENFYKYIPMMSSMNAQLDEDWSNKTLSSWEVEKLQGLLNSSVGQQVQDELAKKDVSGYLDTGRSLGIKDSQALAYFADLYNQSPMEAVAIASMSDKSLEGLYQTSLNNGVLGKYKTRRTNAYESAKQVNMGDIGDSSVGFFSNWQSRVTSEFGDTEGRDHAHGGLDIDGQQGDNLEALAGGKVSFIHMDDGGAYDEDKKANSRAGGTEIGIKMPTGKTYFYSHLAGVNPELLSKYLNGGEATVNAGDLIGNVGGDVGIPGSGYATTGSHLHLGYMDEKGILQNPSDLLNSLSKGDSSIGSMSGGSSAVTVNINITGEGANSLNSMTMTALEGMVRKLMTEIERQRLSLNPTTRGWGTT